MDLTSNTPETPDNIVPTEQSTEFIDLTDDSDKEHFEEEHLVKDSCAIIESDEEEICVPPTPEKTKKTFKSFRRKIR